MNLERSVTENIDLSKENLTPDDGVRERLLRLFGHTIGDSFPADDCACLRGLVTTSKDAAMRLGALALIEHLVRENRMPYDEMMETGIEVARAMYADVSRTAISETEQAAILELANSVSVTIHCAFARAGNVENLNELARLTAEAM